MKLAAYEDSVTTSDTMTGKSPAMLALREDIRRIGPFQSKVLITGESGVGKELVAHQIHAQSPRGARAFVPVNCAGLPETLLESELFGHVKGSFTGAYRDKPGRFELAHQGTVFLDEIGEMTLRMQGLLLRFLEAGELQKIGLDRVLRTVDVRVITATNRRLTDLIEQGQFREDLYYRLNVVHLEVPTLRERKEDIPLLVEHFLCEFHDTNGCRPTAIKPDAMAALMEYRWPGNVRELENVVEKLGVGGAGREVRVEDLPLAIRARGGVSIRPKRERRRTVAQDLYKRLVEDRESFWTCVYPLYMRREITRSNLRDLVRLALQDSRGNYKIVTHLFNLEPRDYKRLLNFLRKHDCQLPFREYR